LGGVYGLYAYRAPTPVLLLLVGLLLASLLLLLLASGV
jgi:hypothetical protein